METPGVRRRRCAPRSQHRSEGRWHNQDQVNFALELVLEVHADGEHLHVVHLDVVYHRLVAV